MSSLPSLPKVRPWKEPMNDITLSLRLPGSYWEGEKQSLARHTAMHKLLATRNQTLLSMQDCHSATSVAREPPHWSLWGEGEIQEKEVKETDFFLMAEDIETHCQQNWNSLEMQSCMLEKLLPRKRHQLSLSWLAKLSLVYTNCAEKET